MKCCNVCKGVKPLDQFSRAARNKDGLRHSCKECSNARCRKRYHQDPEESRRSRSLRARYKMTIEQWDEMMLNQGGMCAICEEEAFLVVDHDHSTGKVRQLLCKGCNIALGGLKDSPDLATKAAEYLKKHKTP